MERIYLFITICIASLIGVGVTLAFGLHPACMMGTIIFIVAIILSMELYFKERREKDERFYEELMAKEKVLDVFMDNFGVDRARAQKLYDIGFHDISDFKGKSVEELMQLPDINPTLAKKIVRNMQKK